MFMVPFGKPPKSGVCRGFYRSRDAAHDRPPTVVHSTASWQKSRRRVVDHKSDHKSGSITRHKSGTPSLDAFRRTGSDGRQFIDPQFDSQLTSSRPSDSVTRPGA
jgi:hypothetical protein